MNLNDMGLFAAVVEEGSISAAARRLGIPKQTVSRRIARLEEELGVQLLRRTTRSLRPTEAGAAYAERCGEVARLAREANECLTSAVAAPRGTLRLTADHVFGEHFLPPLLKEYAERYPEVSIEVMLSRRMVNLVEEGFDLAFRVGAGPGGSGSSGGMRVAGGSRAAAEFEGGGPRAGGSLTSVPLGPAVICYAASAEYLERRGVPGHPDDLGRHECLLQAHAPGPVLWPFRELGRVRVEGRLRLNSFTLVRRAALDGLGIALMPAFLLSQELIPVLGEWTPEVGSVCLVYPTQKFQAARVRAFLELATERLSGTFQSPSIV